MENKITYDVCGYADNPEEVIGELGIGLEAIPGVKSVRVLGISREIRLQEGTFIAGYIVKGNFDPNDGARFIEGLGHNVSVGGQA